MIWRTLLSCALGVTTLTTCASTFAVSIGQVDAFSSGLDFWQQGGPNQPSAGVFHETSGGPAGAGDGFMRIRADNNDEHGNLVAFNRDHQWVGNYTTAGVEAISMSVKNLSSTALQLRIALSSTGTSSGRWWASTAAIPLPGNSGWTDVTFPIVESALTKIQGTGTYANFMTSVNTLRILHAPGPPAFQGVSVNATLGVDNVRALGGSMPGDFNGDSHVNGADLGIWKGDFGVDAGCDLDGDGDTDGADLVIWQRHVDAGGSISAIPEPTAALLAVLAALLLKTRGRS